MLFSLFWWRLAIRIARWRSSFVYQTGRSDCAVAATLTLLKIKRFAAQALSAKEALDPNQQGASLESIRAYLQSNMSHPVDAKRVSAESLRKVRRPAILHMRQLHFVVLLQASRKGVACFDPAKGVVFYTWPDFGKLYSGHCVVPAKKTGPAGAGLKLTVASFSLFLFGATSRVLEVALIVGVTALLFLILNEANGTSLAYAGGVMALAAASLGAVMQIRFRMELSRYQTSLKERLDRWVAPMLNRKDLLGFRGRSELAVANLLRRPMIQGRPALQGGPAFHAGRAVVAIVVLATLALPLSLLFSIGLLAATAVRVLNSVHAGRLSSTGKTSTFFPLLQSGQRMTPEPFGALVGELMKWAVIGTACLAALSGQLQATALMFWILFAMQLVTGDFRNISKLLPVEAEPTLVVAEAPVRRLPIGPSGTSKPTRSRHGISIPVDLRKLEQADLTVKEQRLIMAGAAENALKVFRNEIAELDATPRILGLGHEAASTDVAVMAARNWAPSSGHSDWISRNLTACSQKDLPVLVDVTNSLDKDNLKRALGQSHHRYVAVLGMKRLELLRREVDSQ